MIYLILLFTILFFILAWRRLDLAVMFLIAALPAYLIRFNVLGLPSTLLEVMIWVVFLVWFFKSYKYIFENCKLKIRNCLKIACPPKTWRRGENCKLKIDNRYPFDWEIVFLLLIALVAVGVAGFNASSFGVWKAYFFEPVMLFIVVLNVMKKSPPPPFIKGVELVLWPLAVSALIVSALAIYQKITGQLIDNPLWAAEETRRAVSFFGYPNAVGLYLGPIILVMMGWLFANTASVGQIIVPNRINSKFQAPTPKQLPSTKPQTKAKGFFGVWDLKNIFTGLTIVASVLSIYFAKSKGALLGVAAGLIIFGLLAGKKIRCATIIVLVLIGLGITVYRPAGDLAVENLTLRNISGQIRIAAWSDAWRMLNDGRIITGAGLANYQTAVAPYHTAGIFIKDFGDPDAQRKLVFNEVYRTAHWQPLEIYLYPHNIVLNFWSELGLVGLLLFIWIIVKFFYLGILNFPCLKQDKKFKILNQDLILNDLKLSNSKFNQNSKLIINNFNPSYFKYLNIGLICAMVAIVVHGLVDVPYFKNDLAVMFWLLLAMMGVISLEFNNINKNYN